MAILASLKLTDAEVNVVHRSDQHRRFEGVYCHNRNTFTFCSGAPKTVEGRYLGAGSGAFKRIGQVVFRPSRLEFQARGVSNIRSVECWLNDSRMTTFNRLMPRWTEESLDRTLDIRASQLSSYLLRLRQEVMHPTFAAETVVDALFVILLNDLALYFANQPVLNHCDKDQGNSGAVNRVVERILDIVEVTPTVGELAEMTALSERHLLRVFKQAKGVSLVNFIRQARLERARQLLDSDLPLKEVAYRLGFSSHASFTTAFGREMDVTPGEYRRELRRTVFVGGRC